MKPAVTLITPVYNAMPYLPAYLRSVLDQTWRPLQFILADDGSTDGSVECAEETAPRFAEAGISFLHLKGPHRNQSAAVNDALRYAEGELLTWCDADDLMHPLCIEKKALFLLGHPEIGMVRNDGIVENAAEGTSRRASAEADRADLQIFDALFHETTYCYAGCYMLRMSLFDRCYPDRRIPQSPEGQNLQLLLPPASRTVCGFVPEILHTYIRRDTGHSGKKRSYREMRERILGFSALLRAVLPHCLCDAARYEREIEALEKERLANLMRTAAMTARKELRGK